jgi:2'-5' RNA ligase
VTAPPRLFLAARPSGPACDAVAAALGGWPPPVEPGVRWVPLEQWHVTLRFLGRAEPEDVLGCLAGAGLPAAVARLGPRVSRLGRSVVAVPAAGLDDLAAVVRRATAGVGEPPDPRPFAGHLTLARLKGRPACGVAGAAVSASFPVGEVELVASVTDPAGAIHQVLARLPTGPPEESTGNA